jgi:thiamine biosynthesis lipoprotein
MLRSKGVSCAFVDFGSSSILGIGKHPYGDSWKVGVVDPYTRLQVREISLNDCSMSTSGNAPSYSGHIRNPRTGEPCGGRKLVTVLSDNPLDAEVLSTVLMIAGDKEREIIMANFPESTAIL